MFEFLVKPIQMRTDLVQSGLYVQSLKPPFPLYCIISCPSLNSEPINSPSKKNQFYNT